MYLSSPGSLSHHVNISLECSDHHLNRLSPTNCGGKSTHLSLYHAFCGWQELTIYTQLATIPPLATKSPSAPNPSSLCRNGTTLLSTLSRSSTPSDRRDVWYHFIHTPLLLQPVPKVGVPFQNFSTLLLCFSPLCFKHFSLLFPSRGLDSSSLIQNTAGERGILTCGRQQDLSPAPENCAGPGRDIWVEKQSIGLIHLYRDVVAIAEPTYVEIIDYILTW